MSKEENKEDKATKEAEIEENEKDTIVYEDLDEKEIMKLPISTNNLKSLILKGDVESYPVWIPVFNRETRKPERMEFHVKPISQGDFDYCVASITEDDSLTQLLLAKCVVSKNGSPLGLENAKGLPWGTPNYLVKEIRKLSGHFEEQLF